MRSSMIEPLIGLLGAGFGILAWVGMMVTGNRVDNVSARQAFGIGLLMGISAGALLALLILQLYGP